MIKLKLSRQLIGQFGHVTASASCKQPEKHGMYIMCEVCAQIFIFDISIKQNSKGLTAKLHYLITLQNLRLA